VVAADHRLGLHEQRGPALRAIVDDALEARLRLGADGQDVAAMPHRDVALLKDQVGAGPMEEALEALHDVSPLLASLLPELAQGCAGFVAHAAVRLERAP